jgi:hypothetical protein
MSNNIHIPWSENWSIPLGRILGPSGLLPISRSSWWASVASGRVLDLLKLIDEA